MAYLEKSLSNNVTDHKHGSRTGQSHIQDIFFKKCTIARRLIIVTQIFFPKSFLLWSFNDVIHPQKEKHFFILENTYMSGHVQDIFHLPKLVLLSCVNTKYKFSNTFYKHRSTANQAY